jgi:hypothetical protein
LLNAACRAHPTRTINVIRAPGSDSGLAAIASGVLSAMTKTSYADFTGPINGIHGSIHIWVGGTMSDASVSPLIRCSGSTTPTSTGFGGTGTTARKATIKNPPLIGADALMDPWSYTEADTRDLATLGYTYV